MQQAHQLSEEREAAQQYVSSDELVRALASIESKQMGESANRVKIGEAIQQLGLDMSPEQVLAEVTAERERRSKAVARATQLRHAFAGTASIVAAVVLFAFMIRFLHAQKVARRFGPGSSQTTAFGRDFDSLINSLRSNTFDPGKVATLKMVVKGRRFSSDQVKAILGEFTFDDGRGQAAEVLYPLVSDPQNFYTVLPSFTFDGGREKLIKDLGLDRP